MKKLEINNITKIYPNGKKALNGVDLSFTSGIYGLLGPNGAGKSTLINIITAGISATGGSVEYCGSNIDTLGRNYRKSVGYMPQQQGMYDNFTGKQFLWYMASLKGMKHQEAKTSINELLKVVSLEDVQNRRTGSYSGGMKQRLLLAQALLDSPDILILDEPTAGLDPKERIRIRNFISEIAREKIVIIATHIVSDIECIAKDIILLGNGCIIDEGTPRELIRKLDGCVWEGSIDENRLNEYSKAYCVSSVVLAGDRYVLRMVADEAPDGFNRAEPTLEEVYLYYFQYLSEQQQTSITGA